MPHTKEFQHLKIQLEAIISATNNFSVENYIGKGGFGKVYKGEIIHCKGQSMVAFKRLDRAFGQGNPEFWKEIMMLSLYRHENIANPQSTKVVDITQRIVDSADTTKRWLSEIVDSSQLRALRFPDPMAASKVMRLIYTNSGAALLALTSSAIHKLWKWQRIDRNPYGKSTASVIPQLWQPTNGALMCNDVSESKPAEELAASILLSKNDCYIISASGGKVSLFNVMTFKVMKTFMRPQPAATYLASDPRENNCIAIGMDDSTIQIYNVRVDEVIVLAFSRGSCAHWPPS
ncbi:hypothetical protein L6452_32024 [Arctium lappa]|uniref:Uncharacterized protein n=1 Tax=Arctium lappa TaxID=4217 RepID=A0ACB8Z3S6_ARCLA|nr:hypothetical protein L6452_32024 [Arctium lappa]